MRFGRKKELVETRLRKKEKGFFPPGRPLNKGEATRNTCQGKGVVSLFAREKKKGLPQLARGGGEEDSCII